MSKGIRLHPEHCLNPTISLCILCGKEKNEIALLGAHYKDKAPMHMITGIEPCGACKEKYLKEGVMLVEATEGAKGPVITGNVLVLKDEAFKRIIDKPIPRPKVAYMEPEAFQMLLKLHKEGA